MRDVSDMNLSNDIETRGDENAKSEDICEKENGNPVFSSENDESAAQKSIFDEPSDTEKSNDSDSTKSDSDDSLPHNCENTETPDETASSENGRDPDVVGVVTDEAVSGGTEGDITAPVLESISEQTENEPIYFPITDDELTAKDIDAKDINSKDINSKDANSPEQTSISDIDENIPESEDIKEPIAVEIPVEADDDQLIVKTHEKKPEVKTRPIDNRFDFIELFVFTVVSVLLVMSFIFRHSIVDGGSMERTLFDGEHPSDHNPVVVTICKK